MVGLMGMTEKYMHAGLSVLQQAAEYGYSSSVYAPQPRDAQLQMPSWAWFLVTIAVLSISVAGEPWAHTPLTTEAIRAHTAQATTCVVLAAACSHRPDCLSGVLTTRSWHTCLAPSIQPRPDLTEVLSLQASSLRRGIISTEVSSPIQYINPESNYLLYVHPSVA